MKTAERTWPRPPLVQPKRVGLGLTRLQMQSLEAWQRKVAGLEQLEQKGPAVKGSIKVTYTLRPDLTNSSPSLDTCAAVLSEQLVRLQIITSKTQIAHTTIQWGEVPLGVLIKVEEI